MMVYLQESPLVLEIWLIDLKTLRCNGPAMVTYPHQTLPHHHPKHGPISSHLGLLRQQHSLARHSTSSAQPSAARPPAGTLFRHGLRSMPTIGGFGTSAPFQPIRNGFGGAPAAEQGVVEMAVGEWLI